MRRNLVNLCTLVVVLLTMQIVTFGQRTKISVHKGKVKAQTPTASVTVDAGQEVILAEGKEPKVNDGGSK